MADKVVKLPIRKKENDTVLVRVPEYSGPCMHIDVTYFVDERSTDVTCGACDARLSPMWVLGRLANEERRLIELHRRYVEAKRAAEKRIRTKCEHCKQITRIKGLP